MPQIKLEVLKKEKAYSKELKKCFLCTAEKIEIMKRINDPHNVNKRSELMAKCLHRERHLLSPVNIIGLKPAYAVNWNSTDASMHSMQKSSIDFQKLLFLMQG